MEQNATLAVPVALVAMTSKSEAHGAFAGRL